jgi:hypothetical protein
MYTHTHRARAQAFVADTLPNSQIVAVVLSSSSSSSSSSDAVTKQLADSLREDGFALGAVAPAAAVDVAQHYGVDVSAAAGPTLLLFKNFNEDSLGADDASSSSSSSAPVVYASTAPWTAAALHAWCSEQARCRW